MIRGAMQPLARRISAFFGQPLQLGLWDSDVRALPWQVRESARAGRMAARVFHDGRVEIVVPMGTRPHRIRRFAESQRAWIERASQRAAERRSAVPRAEGTFPPVQLQLPALGEHWQWHKLPLRSASPEAQRLELLTWLRERAVSSLLPPLQALAAEMGTDFAQLQIRWQRTRWGSCSRRGTISLNGCLLFQRPAVVRYLMVHELSHRFHMNHGAAFWQRVALHEPDWRALDRELSRGWQTVPAWVLKSGIE